MRDLGLIPPKSTVPKNFRTVPVEFKVEIIDFKTVTSKDQLLNQEHSDNLYIEFIDFLLENLLYDLADSCLGYIKNHTTE